jgi:hypothetical protein
MDHGRVSRYQDGITAGQGVALLYIILVIGLLAGNIRLRRGSRPWGVSPGDDSLTPHGALGQAIVLLVPHAGRDFPRGKW